MQGGGGGVEIGQRGRAGGGRGEGGGGGLLRSLKESSAFECNQAPLKGYQVPGRWRETDAPALAASAAYRCEGSSLLPNYCFKCLISVFQY